MLPLRLGVVPVDVQTQGAYAIIGPKYSFLASVQLDGGESKIAGV
jgi:hypothetical protein